MKTQKDQLVIVYQFGKVASTSLVKCLNRIDGVEAVQCHFLGESALSRIIPIAVDKATSPYFHEHLAGQLAANVALTYRMNRIHVEAKGDRLKIISLSRHPLDWLRSCIQQDIVGYAPDLRAYGGKKEDPGNDEGAALQAGLARVLADVAALMDAFGGIAQVTDVFLSQGGKEMMRDHAPVPDQIVRRFFFLALRPLVWFEEHFRACFGFGLDSMIEENGFWHTHQAGLQFLLLRYEDLHKKLMPAMHMIDVPIEGPLERENTSDVKPFAAEITAAFSSPGAMALQAHLLQSGYAKHFGYDIGVPAATAAE